MYGTGIGSKYGTTYWYPDFKLIDGVYVFFEQPVHICTNWDDIELRRSYGRLESATMRYNIIAKEAEWADDALRRDVPPRKLSNTTVPAVVALNNPLPIYSVVSIEEPMFNPATHRPRWKSFLIFKQSKRDS